MCSSSTKTLLKNISKAIIAHDLYVNTNVSSSGLIPNNSKFFTNGANTNDKPNWRSIYDELEYKVKVEDSDNTKVGHFRFYLPPILGPQILIVIHSKDRDVQRRRLLMMFYGNNLFYHYLQSFFVDMANCVVKPLSLTSNDMRACLDYSICEDKLDSAGDVELWFGKLDTKGKLGSIVINIEDKHLKKLRKTFKARSSKDTKYLEYGDMKINNKGATIPIYADLIEKTCISFDKLKLVRIKCSLFSLSFDGRVNFTDLMTPSNREDSEAKVSPDDQRVSIWFVLNIFINSL